MRQTPRTQLLGIGLCLVMASGCATTGHQTASRPLPNFRQVDAHLYRGGQPTEAGFRQLQAMGIQTIISLRAHRLRDAARREQRALVESLGMRWVSLPMRMYWRPSEAQVLAFLETALAAEEQPVFLHCQHGEDRTGSLVAIYRIIKQGWTPDRAYTEAVALGMAPWNRFMRHLILHEVPRAYL